MKLNNNDDSHNSGLNLLIYNMLLDIESHPTWVCGLKPALNLQNNPGLSSHPTWVCGLKQANRAQGLSSLWSHPTWVCGLKLAQMHPTQSTVVTPYVGVWIETPDLLKAVDHCQVTPYVGVWIETSVIGICLPSVLSHTLRGCVD